MPQDVQLELISEYPALPSGANQEFYLLARILPPRRIEELPRPPLNVCLVLDRSGSMGGAKLRHAKEAAIAFVDQLLPQDRFSLVAFDSEVEILVPNTPAVDKEPFKQAIADIFGGSRTALHEAWVRGGLEVSCFLNEGGINRIILLTDGLANVGETRTEVILTHTRELAQRGVTTSTIGIGFDFHEDLLIPMAEAGQGNAVHVVESGDLNRILSLELESLTTQVGYSVTAGLTTSQGFKVLEVLNDFQVNAKGQYQLPQICCGIPLDVVLKCITLDLKQPGTHETLSVELNWTAQKDGKPQTIHQHLSLPRSNVRHQPAHKEVRKITCLLKVARAKREAVRCIDEERPVEARQCILEALQLTAVTVSELGSDPALQEQIRILDRLETELANSGDQSIPRKMMTYQIYGTNTCRLR